MKELFDNYYEEAFSQSKSQRLDLHSFELAAKKFRWNYRHFFQELPKDVAILDYGCGIGQFLYFLKKEGFKNIIGIDVSKTQIDIAFKMQPDVDFRHVENATKFLQENTEKYNVVVLNDVLEHIEVQNTINLMKNIYNSIRPGGVVIIKTINSAYPFGSSLRYIDMTHTTAFHKKSLIQLLRHVGFKDISYFQEEIGIYNFLFFLKKIVVFAVRIFVKLLIYFTECDWQDVISLNLIVSGVKSKERL